MNTHVIKAMLYTWASPSKRIQITYPANCHSEVIGFIRKKEAASKCNVIRHEKAKFKRFLSEQCLLDECDECSFHHEFWKKLKETSEGICYLIVSQHSATWEPFNISKPKEVINLTMCLFLQYMIMISYLFWLART